MSTLREVRVYMKFHGSFQKGKALMEEKTKSCHILTPESCPVVISSCCSAKQTSCRGTGNTSAREGILVLPGEGVLHTEI